MSTPDSSEVPWYSGLPGFQAEIECQGEAHHLLWRDGALSSLDHDLDAEMAIVALGGEEPECLKAVRGWEMRTEIPELLALRVYAPGTSNRSSVSFGGSSIEQLRLSAERNLDMLSRALTYLAASGVSGSGAVQRTKGLQADLERSRRLRALALAGEQVLSLALGDFIAHRIRLSQEEEANDSVKMAVSDFLTNNVGAALEDSLRSWRRLPPAAVVTTEAWLAAPFSDPAIFGWVSHQGGFAGVTVGLDWATEVLLHGLAVVDGCFILKRVRSAEDRSWHEVLAVRWTPQWHGTSPMAQTDPEAIDKLDRYFADRWMPEVAPARVLRGADGWRVSWGS